MRRLLIRPGAIGDLIVSLPAMEALRADFTEVWCAEPNVPLVRFADCVRSIGQSGLDRLGLLPADDAMERLRPFDSIVSWYGTQNEEFRRAVGALKLPFEFRPALPDGARHAVEFYGGGSRFPSIPCPAMKRTFAAVHPFASSVAKRAPMEVFERAAQKLAESMPVHWLRGPEETLAGAVLFGDLYELACWLRGARVFIGNDSGISHLAAAVGTPVQSLFTSTEPRVWAPRGPASWPCGLAASDEGHGIRHDGHEQDVGLQR